VDFNLVEQLRLHADKPVSVGQSAEPGLDFLCAQAVVRESSGILRLVVSRQPESKPESFELALVHRAGEFIFAGAEIRWRVLPGGSRPAVRRLGCEFFDADRVGERIRLRHWQPGDRFQPIGMAAPLKLQDLFTNQKILRRRRHELILATTASGEIFWVEGLRISERFKLSNQSRRRLRWQWARI
jgi:tRNA(Ile)-lysidine synthetase-like protein